ncbi:MAG: guanylate kinase [FCB group bacterium]|nr:guanylate kinase [FCB group bacterium]
MRNKGLLVIFVSFSGGGKSTIIRTLKERHPDWKFSVSCTTRAPRKNEEEGVHYYFIAQAHFEEMILNNAFIEYEEVHGDMYGTPKGPLDNALEENRVFILDIDVNGALNVLRMYREHSVSFFIDVPDMQILEERLRKRGSESEESINKRLSRIPEERKEKDKFDYVILNDKLEVAINEIEEKIMQQLEAQ